MPSSEKTDEYSMRLARQTKQSGVGLRPTIGSKQTRPAGGAFLVFWML